MTVIEVEAATGVSADVVRWYVRKGLLRPRRNARNRYHQFGPGDVRELAFIGRAKELGFTLEEIRRILDQSRRGESPCPQMRDIVKRRAVGVAAQVETLVGMEKHMRRALRLWRRMPDGVQPAHSAQQGGGLLFHYCVVPAEVVLAHAEDHAERGMHQGKAKQGTSHTVLALFEDKTGLRVADAEVTLHLTLAGGRSATTKLEPMTIADQAGYGAFVTISVPGIYRLRFDARRPAVARSAHAEFEHRVPGPERGR